MNFSETINADSLLVQVITIQSDQSSTMESVTLQDSTSMSSNGPVITVILSTRDLNSIKMNPLLAIDANTTYLSLLSNAIMDMSALQVETIFPTSAFPVDQFVPDTTGPEIDNFELDMDTGIFELTFNEYVNRSSLDLSLLTLRSSRDPSAESYQLTNTQSEIAFGGTLIRLQLSLADVNEIKRRRELALSVNSTYLEAASGAILDMNFNPLMAIEPSSAQLVTMYTGDTNRPEMTSFSFDVNTAILTIHFSETIDANSTNLTLITLQDAADTSLELTLSGGTTGGDSPSLEINIIESDLNEMTRVGICTLQSNCFVHFPEENLYRYCWKFSYWHQ